MLRFGTGLSIVLVLLLNLLLWNHRDTYTIRDGGQVVIHTTAETSLAQILEDAGIELGAADQLTAAEEKGGPVLQVLRLQTITIDRYGELLEVESYGETVGQLLERLDMTPEERDKISAPLEQQTYDGMMLRIYREFRQEQIYTAVLPREILYCCDPTLAIGEERLLTPGQDGEVLRMAEVVYTNGVETERKILWEELLIQPVTEVVAVGTGQLTENPKKDILPVIGNGLIRLPTGEVLTYSKVISSLATAYCNKGLTATGTQARVGAIAVDPEYIPYGTRMFIMTKDGEYIYGIATAEDCGSKQFIYGTRIDLHYDTEAECIQFGARMCWVYFLS